MKKFLILTLVLASFSAMSQAKDGAIKTNLIVMPFGIVNLAYEMSMNDKSSLQLGVSIVSVDFIDTSISGFGIAPEYRIYSGEALQGFYFGPVARYASLIFSEGTLSVVGVGGQFGWNWLLGKSDSFVMNLGLGAVYYSGSIKEESHTDSFALVASILSFSIGYAW